MEYRTCRLHRKIYRAQKKIYDENESCIFYQIITDANNHEMVDSDLYACPNCGAAFELVDEDWIVTKIEKR